MASTDLRFDVQALDRASQVFTRMGRAVENFEKRLDRLDKQRVSVDVEAKTEKAERQVGAFAADMQRRLTRAIEALPDIELGADATEAQREVAAVRTELAQLADQRVGIDIDATEAQTRVAELQRRLQALDGDDADIQVRTDVAAALTQLAAVNGEVDRLDGRTARVKVDVDRGLGDTIVRVAALGRALGTLTLPAAALAAAPTIASIGAAAVTASGALGVLPAAAAAAAVGVGTLTVGLQNMGDALDEDPEKAAEAIAKLAPAAREAVTAIRGFAPAWKALQLDVQQRLFDGLGTRVTALGRTYLPILRGELGRVADGFNLAATRVANMLTESSRVGDVRVMLGSLATSWENVLGAVGPLSAALVDVGVVGSGVLRDLTSGAQDSAASFQQFISRARESGDLARWMQDGVEQVRQFGRIARDAGVTAYNVFRQAEEAGAGFFDTLERGTAAARAWTSSVEGSDLIVRVFRTLRETVDAVVPGVQALGRVVGDVLDGLLEGRALQRAGQLFTDVAEAAEPVLSVLGAIATTVLPPLLDAASALAPVLVPVAAGLLAIKLATAGWAAASRFPQWLMSARDNALGAEQRLTMLGRAVEGVKAPFIGAAGSVRQFRDEMALQRGLAQMQGQELGRLGAAAAAFEASQLGAVRGAREFRDAVSGSYRQTSTAVQGFAATAGAAGRQASEALGDRLASATQRGVSGILAFPAAARAAGTAVRTGLVTALDATERTLRGLPATVSAAGSAVRSGLVTGATAAGSALRTLGTQAVDAGRAVGTGLATGVRVGVDGLRALPAAAQSAGTALVSNLRSGASSAVEALRSLPAAAADAGRSLGTTLQSGAQSAGRALADGLRSGVTAAGEAVRALPGQVASAASATATAAANGLRAIPDHIRTAFSTVGGAVDAAVGHLGRFTGAVAGVGTSIGTGLMRAGSSLVGFLGGPWGVALAAAGVALSVLASNHAEAQAAAEEQKAALETLRGTLDEYSGAVTQATVNERAKELSTKTLADGTTTYLQAVRSLGIDLNDYTQASLGNADALDRVRSQLDATTSATIAGSREYKTLQSALAGSGITMADFTAAASGGQEATDKIRDAILGLHDATGRNNPRLAEMFNQLLANSGASAELAAQLGITTGELAAIQEQVRLAAEASGRLTEQLTSVKSQFDAVPDAKEITIESTSPEVIQQLRDLGFEVTQLKDGTVRVNLEDAEARARFDALMVTLSTASAAPVLDLNTATAQQKADGVKAYIDGLVGIATADANAAPGTAKADQLKAHMDGIVGILTADANPAPGTEKANQLQAHMNGLIGILTADANNAPGTAKGDALRGYIDGLLAIMTADANTAPGTAKGDALKAYIDRLRASIVAEARTQAAEDALNWAARQRTATVQLKYAGVMPGGSAPGRPLAGGGVLGYAGGGLAPASRVRAARGLVVPGYRPGVDDVPAVLSRGEAVLVPELVRALGARRILAANAEASGGRAATVVGRIASMMDGTIDRRPRVRTAGGSRAASVGGGSGLPSAAQAALQTTQPQVVVQSQAPPELRAMLGQLRALRGDVDQSGPLGTLIGEMHAVRRLLERGLAGGGSYADTARDAGLWGAWA